MNHVFQSLLILMITIVLVRGLLPIATRWGFVDNPGGRKKHDGEIPLVGGLAMFGGFFPALMLDYVLKPSTQALVAGSLILIVIGVLDDWWDLSVKMRFIAQISAALIMCLYGGIVFRNLGDLLFLGSINLEYMGIPFTVFAAVGVINAMNMSDGLDGLAGGLALVTVAALTAITWHAGLSVEFYLLLSFICVLIGFLAFNVRTPWRPYPRVFMGDSGSMFLGFVLAWLLISLTQGTHPAMSPVTAAWIFALPLLDTINVIVRRILNGQSPFKADRQHFHHMLLLAGFSVSQALLINLGLAALLAVIGIAGDWEGIPEGIMFIGFLVLFAVYFLVVNHAWKARATIRANFVDDEQREEVG